MRRSILLLLGLAACAPNPSAPVPVAVMAINNAGVYEPRVVALETVTDVIALRGSAARLIGGARIVDDPNELQRQSALNDEQLRIALLKGQGLPPRASYIDRQGVLWPSDFHTWNMVTTYYNFEQAFRYFQSNGWRNAENLDPATQAGPTVYYFPSLTLSGSPELRDNALYFSPIQAFAVLPFDRLQSVPLPMNSGIIAHEFAHKVFNSRAYGGASIPLPFTTAWVPPEGGFTTPAANLARSLDEGLADFHAFGASCNTAFGCTTRFLEPSLGKDATDLRDFAQPGKCMDANLRNALNNLPLALFLNQGLEYRVGTVLAAALRRASFPNKLQTMQQALLAAYDDSDARKLGIRQLITLNANTPAGFTLPRVAQSILQHITDPNLRTDTCSAFMSYLQIPKDQLIAPSGAADACPAAAAPFPRECPNIN